MSATSSAYHPTFSYEVDPLLNISPLIDLYSDCLTHVVDTDGLFQLPAHNSPVILSYKGIILDPSPSYQTSFARVRSHRCLLTIVAFFISWTYTSEELLEYVIPTSYGLKESPSVPTRDFASLYPQTFITLTNQSSTGLDLGATFWIRCQSDRSLFFILRLTNDLTSYPRIFGSAVMENIGGLAFKCSTYGSCKSEIEQKIRVIANAIRLSWQFGNFDGNSSGGDPFDRSAKAGIDEALDHFILGPPNRRFNLAAECPPRISSNLDTFMLTPKELIPAGKTSVVKFVTTAGVFTRKVSYLVYFSPFWPMAWLGILTSVGVTFAMMIGVFRMHGTEREVEIGLLRLSLELATWMLAAAVGQYKHSRIPLLNSGSVRRRVIWVVAPVFVSWFILSTFLASVYSAVFNSAATQPFYYLTNYTNFLQFPFGIQTYILVNESYVRQYKAHNRVEHCIVEDYKTNDFCSFHKNIPAACAISSAITTALAKAAGAAYGSVSTDTLVIQDPRLEEERVKYLKLPRNPALLCAKTESLIRVLLKSGKPLVFLINDHDFQKYWQLFVYVMDSNPNIKVANNFDTDDSFLSESVALQFSSGHHHMFTGSVLERMKSLLSSGIYGLWQKWNVLKFTDGGGAQDGKGKLLRENKLEPLSFENSGTLWIFQAEAFAWVLASGVLGCEVLVALFTSWCWKSPFSLKYLDRPRV